MHPARAPKWFVVMLAACVLTAGPPAARAQGRDTWQQPERVVADLGLKSGSVIADIGAGSGYLTFRLAKAVGPEGKVFATEIVERLVKGLAERAKREKAANVEAVLSEPTDTKLATDSLDSALVLNVLHHVAKDKRLDLVKDIVRAIKPGGYFFIIDWREKATIGYDRGLRIPRDELVNLGKDAGCTLDAEFLYLEHQVFLRFRKPATTEAAGG